VNILIFDPIGGASGDMILGSLVHLGCPPEYLIETWDSLKLSKGSTKELLKISEKRINGIVVADLRFSLQEDTHHAHDDQIPGNGHFRTHEEIRQLIHDSSVPERIQTNALKIFGHIAQAEATVHGVATKDVHFHEIGAVDSILDIVGIAAALEWFKIRMSFYRPLPLGNGLTKSMHGNIPVPAPATMNLLEGVRVRFTGVKGELTTPTGAGVIRAMAEPLIPDLEMEVLGEGYGCGDHEYDGWPNMFRSILCRMNAEQEKECEENPIQKKSKEHRHERKRNI